jgi:uncharacterized membrane protein
MLVTLPIGLWIFSFVCDLVSLSSPNPAWDTTADLTLGGGIIGALLAALPGYIDLLALREGNERRIGMTHMSLNLAIVVVQVINFWLRSRPDGAGSIGIVLSFISVVALVASGWLGGQLVHVLGVTQPDRQTAASTTTHDRPHPRT